jgi:hypothetical protein
MARIEFKEQNFDRLPIVGARPKSDKEEKFLREVGLYEFINKEQPGAAVKFTYGNTKVFTEPTLFHGGKYRLPRHIVRHLENCQVPMYTYLNDPSSGRLGKTLQAFNSRYQCRPLYE